MKKDLGKKVYSGPYNNRLISFIVGSALTIVTSIIHIIENGIPPGIDTITGGIKLILGLFLILSFAFWLSYIVINMKWPINLIYENGVKIQPVHVHPFVRNPKMLSLREWKDFSRTWIPWIFRRRVLYDDIARIYVGNPTWRVQRYIYLMLKRPQNPEQRYFMTFTDGTVAEMKKAIRIMQECMGPERWNRIFVRSNNFLPENEDWADYVEPIRKLEEL